MCIPRPEHPNPQFERENWINLNGEWDFEIDNSQSGEERGLQNKNTLSGKIIVPFCPESELSVVQNKDFMACVWYKKTVVLDEDFLKGNVILTIGACDYHTKIWVNGTFCKEHFGGFTPIKAVIGDLLHSGTNIITVCAYDDTRSGNQPCGKQSPRFGSFGCFYTRTTGIWQTVFLESVPKSYVEAVKFTPDISGNVIINASAVNSHGKDLNVRVYFENDPVGEVSAVVNGNTASAIIKIESPKLWDTQNPNLYTVQISLGEDKIKSYFGIRSVAYNDHRLYLNKKSIFGRFVLDQGFYPNGIFTAPCESDLKNDIQLSLDCGFNGARLHQKVFEPRFLYHCDKMGYLVWGEHANWGLDISRPEGWKGFINEWVEILNRDYNHPCIIGWCPLNETQHNQDAEFVKTLYNITKSIDNTRIFIDCSGWTHVDGVCDMLDCHTYEQDPEKLNANITDPMGKDAFGVPYTDKLCFVSEFGGTSYWENRSEDDAWGYGNAPKTMEEFMQRLEGLVSVLLKNENLCAFCYTQLTDVEQEQNGIYTYTRKAKFDLKAIKSIISAKAACEE